LKPLLKTFNKIMKSSTTAFTAIVLAGDRAAGDPLAQAAGVACKSFVPVGGRSMVLRVLDTLDAASQVGARILCGPSQALIEQEPELNASIEAGRVKWIASQATPSLSAFHALQSLHHDTPVLITTADHALLTTKIVDVFCAEARQAGCDVAVALANYEQVTTTFPESKRTAIKFKDGAYCGCNLFGFLNSQAYMAAQFWRQIEQDRKKPLRMMRILGWWTVVRHLLGRMSLADALEQVSSKIGIRAGAVILPFPEAAVDVDTIDDWRFVQDLVAKVTL
jgi:GTP:adenosylcobinamide-phosphate guanylyltransferase